MVHVAGGERWSLVATFPGHPRAFVAFQVRITPELKQRLEEYAFKSRRSQVSIITEALETYLNDALSKLPSQPDESPGD